MPTVTAEHRPGTPWDAVAGVVPAQVVRPSSVAEVVGVLRGAAADGRTVVPVGGAAPLLPRTRTVTKLVGAASVEPTAGRVSAGGSAVTVIDQVPVPTPPPGGTPGPPPVSGEVGSSEEQPAAASNRPAAAAWRRLFSARFSFMAGLPL